MFFFYCLTLLLLVYIAPGLALYPKLILSSRTVVALPFVSIATVVIVKLVLERIGHWSHTAVLGVSLTFLVIAIARIVRLIRRDGFAPAHWPVSHCFLLLLSILFGIYWAAQLGTTGFDTDDEIYSWHMWAIQHYLGHEIDFYYTQSPYPQLFPVLIAYCYKLLGNVELQLPVKALFALFPVSLWGAIAVAPREASLVNAIRSTVVMILLAGAIGRYFSSGLADPLMAASLVMAIYLYIQYVRKSEHRELLYLSVICAAVALYTKQAALIWALFSFPAIAVISIAQKRVPLITLAGAAILFTLGLSWIVGEGSGFQDNHGVINASREGRDIIDQLLFSVRDQITDHPLTVLFVVFATMSVFAARCHRDILVFFLGPALLAWLVYGAYSLRLGIHLTALSALLITATGFTLPRVFDRGLVVRSSGLIHRRRVTLAVLILILVTGSSIYRVNRNMDKYGDNFSFYIGGKNSIIRYFGKDATFVFQELYNRPDLLLWVPSNYIYGIFYGHTPMMRPAYRENSDYSLATLFLEISDNRPDYLFESGGLVDNGPGSALLRELAINRCPDLFEQRVAPPNELGYTVFRLISDDRLFEQCGTRLD